MPDGEMICPDLKPASASTKDVDYAEVRNCTHVVRRAGLVGVAVGIDSNAFAKIESSFYVHPHVEQGPVKLKILWLSSGFLHPTTRGGRSAHWKCCDDCGLGTRSTTSLCTTVSPSPLHAVPSIVPKPGPCLLCSRQETQRDSGFRLLGILASVPSSPPRL